MISALPEQRGDIETRLHSCRQFLEELEELRTWVTSTREFLQQAKQGPASLTADEEQDSIIVDTKVSGLIVICDLEKSLD